jgi:hypothetical protein
MPAADVISINRAPVLTLWAAVVAERLGFDRAEALSLGRGLAGLNAQSKGRQLGIFKPHEEKPSQARKKQHDEQFLVELCGRGIPAVNTPDGVRAVSGGKPLDAESVEDYLEGKFGDQAKAARTAMTRLARSYTPERLAAAAFDLYERFRPAIPAGKKGWGAKGELDLKRIASLAPARVKTRK